MPKNKKKYTNNFEEVEKLFNYLDNAKLFQENVGNKERFELLAGNAEKPGDAEYAEVFSNIASELKNANKFFNTMDDDAFKNINNNKERFDYVFSEDAGDIELKQPPVDHHNEL